MARLILVSAVEHPDLDDWVRDHAITEASEQGWELGNYLGREDVLKIDDPDMCCHVFAVSA